MSSPAVTVRSEVSLEDCLNPESHQIRRMPVVDDDERCCGIVSQADIAGTAPAAKTAELVREVSKQS